MKQYGERLQVCFTRLTEAVNNDLKEDSDEVQHLMEEYYSILGSLKPVSKKRWLRMGVEISQDKVCYSMYAKMHPKLPAFLAKAINIYGKNIKE